LPTSPVLRLRLSGSYGVDHPSIKGERKMKLSPNGKAPDFGLLDQNGKKVLLSDFKGGKLLLFFYPKAGTSG